MASDEGTAVRSLFLRGQRERRPHIQRVRRENLLRSGRVPSIEATVVERGPEREQE